MLYIHSVTFKKHFIYNIQATKVFTFKWTYACTFVCVIMHLGRLWVGWIFINNKKSLEMEPKCETRNCQWVSFDISNEQKTFSVRWFSSRLESFFSFLLKVWLPSTTLRCFVILSERKKKYRLPCDCLWQFLLRFN